MLCGVSFTVPAGTMLGIMGRSGSGKTTVTRLLQCLNTNYDGMIKIDGIDLREINLTHLRTHIGVVPQENFLFSGTLRDNIAMAKPDATFAEVVRAAQLSGAEEFIERLPRGYDTPIQEGGSNLSGGQRQRLALARALLIDPPVLILDEATSALDAESEAIVNANLKRMAKGRRCCPFRTACRCSWIAMLSWCSSKARSTISARTRSFCSAATSTSTCGINRTVTSIRVPADKPLVLPRGAAR